MANTRTLLAWIRTSIALVGLGFVVARFGIFLREVAPSALPPPAPELAPAIGTVLVLVGAGVAGLSLQRFRATSRGIEAGRFDLDLRLEMAVGVATVVGGLALAGYLLIVR